jgi:hypothetical protein
MTEELGDATLGTAVVAARGWTIATWLVGHADRFQITSVSFAGRQWTPRSGTWNPYQPNNPWVRIQRRTSASPAR